MKTTTLPFWRIASIFLALFVLACSSDDNDEQVDQGPDFAISELAGTWNATEITFSYSGTGNVPDPSFYQVVAEGGSGVLTVQSSGRFTLAVTPIGEATETFGGRMYFEDGEFFAIQFDDDPPDDPTYFGATLSGNTFSLNGGPDTAEWDFDGDGNDEPASVSLVFVKA
ncbi:MAG: hypothetical protein OER83_06950 [Flavobacteriaceae bacterium]|nr:hypothetical protein [Flavobacteriaceae bacterium]